MSALSFAYYCSGHGYGHATRVDAFICHLLTLPDKPTIHIVSSAPKHVFSASVVRGALYRYAEIDPVIVQPVAYRVDRQKSVQVLHDFIKRKDDLLEVERLWLSTSNIQCVLSDAAFLGCLAAKAAGIPSVLITNFTFDSVYSYLATELLDLPASTEHLHPEQSARHHHLVDHLMPDVPVPPSELNPLVDHIYSGYRCADLLVLLPGHIPIPSFSVFPSLPSPEWVDPHSNTLQLNVVDHLLQPPSSFRLLPSIPFPSTSTLANKSIIRSAIPAPLIVRPSNPSIYTPEGRSLLLSSIGVPVDLHDPERTKILIVSFGGQVFRTPNRSGSRTPSRRQSQDLSVPIPEIPVTPPVSAPPNLKDQLSSGTFPNFVPPRPAHVSRVSLPNIHDAGAPNRVGTTRHQRAHTEVYSPGTSSRLATPSHLWVPGAPPAAKGNFSSQTSSPALSAVPSLSTIPPSPSPDKDYFDLHSGQDVSSLDDEPRFLPDSSWIAIVCGVSKEQWRTQDEDSDLPEGFFVAPRDIYMPDLTAVSDVLLGKLGYGTVSECLDACTPFVYVSRPLFIEEQGLRLLLQRDGVGIELSRESYENGDWATFVQEAWLKGKGAKALKRQNARLGLGMNLQQEGRDVARRVVDWAKNCWT